MFLLAQRGFFCFLLSSSLDECGLLLFLEHAPFSGPELPSGLVVPDSDSELTKFAAKGISSEGSANRSILDVLNTSILLRPIILFE